MDSTNKFLGYSSIMTFSELLSNYQNDKIELVNDKIETADLQRCGLAVFYCTKIGYMIQLQYDIYSKRDVQNNGL